MYLQLISLLTAFLPDPKTDILRRLDTFDDMENVIAQDCVDSRLRAGKCIPLAKCPVMVEEFYDEARKNSYGVDFQTFISNSLCGFDGVNFLICCSIRPFYSITMTKPSVQLPAPTTTKPYQQIYESTPFLFAPLGTNAPAPTASKNIMPPVIYPISNKDIITPATTTHISPMVFTTSTPPTMNTTPDMGVVIFQPTVMPPSGGNVVIQPIPNQTPTQGTLISQTVPQPIIISTTTSPSTCGVSRATINRVVGGYETRRGNYPWMAALGYRNEYDPNTIKYLCGGSLISSRYVITSAHCVNNYLMLVRLGAHDLSNPAESEARNYQIKRSIVHENFDLKSITNDLALLELSESVRMTNYISTICLPEDPKFLQQDFVGMNPFVAGWGATKHQAPTSNVLRDVQVPIINRQVCEQSYRTVFNFVKFSEMLICAGNSNVDACQGDSGGPLMMPQMVGNSFQYYLLGVVSFGYECARTGFPGVYTRVAAYMPWIKSNMI
ncbi:proclotting enzyme-like [Cochliomyia hominivorax]